MRFLSELLTGLLCVMTTSSLTCASLTSSSSLSSTKSESNIDNENANVTFPDLYEASIAELQAGLEKGLFTSVDLVKVPSFIFSLTSYSLHLLIYILCGVWWFFCVLVLVFVLLVCEPCL